MAGWRVSRADLAAEVWRFAPDVAVIDGPDHPPTVRMTDASAAGRRRRADRKQRRRNEPSP
jgi:hypothetical protein